jgi:predicted NUDIX family NTP pyrophosphohydrolase
MAATKDLENIKVKEEPSAQTAAGEVYQVGVVILRWEKGEPEFWIGRMNERVQVVEKEVEEDEESWQAAAKAVLTQVGVALDKELIDEPVRTLRGPRAGAYGSRTRTDVYYLGEKEVFM